MREKQAGLERAAERVDLVLSLAERVPSGLKLGGALAVPVLAGIKLAVGTMASWTWWEMAVGAVVILWFMVVIVVATRARRQRRVKPKRELLLRLVKHMHRLTPGYRHDPTQKEDPIAETLNEARMVFGRDRQVVDVLDQMLKNPGHLSVHFPMLIKAMSKVTGEKIDPATFDTAFISSRAPSAEDEPCRDGQRLKALAPEIKAAREAAEAGKARAVTDIAGLIYDFEEMGIQYPRQPHNINELEPWCWFLSLLHRMAERAAIGDARLLIFECNRRFPNLSTGRRRGS